MKKKEAARAAAKTFPRVEGQTLPRELCDAVTRYIITSSAQRTRKILSFSRFVVVA
jgi:hypothetical protein